MRALAASAVLIALGWGPLWPPDASAQPTKREIEQARKHHLRGTELFEAGNLEAAIAEFEIAYKLSNAPGVLFNLATALFDAKRCREAAEHFEQFAKADPTSPLHNEAIDMATKARECDKEEERKAAATAAARAARDDPGQPVREVVVSQPSVRPQRSTRWWIGGALGITGIALVGTGAVFGLKTNSDADELSRRYGDGGVWDSEADALESRYRRDKTLAYTFAGLGGALVATGAALVVWELWRGENADQSPVAAVISPTQRMLLWSVRFE